MKFENVVIKPGFPRSRPIYIYKGYNGEILLYVVMQLPFIVLLLLYCNIVHWKSNIVHSTRTQKQGSFRNSIFSKLTENNIIIKTRQLITFGILSFDKRSYMQIRLEHGNTGFETFHYSDASKQTYGNTIELSISTTSRTQTKMSPIWFYFRLMFKSTSFPYNRF